MFLPKVITSTAKQKEILKKLSGSTKEKRRIAERAELLMYILNNNNPSNLKVMAHFNKGMSYVKKWRDRWHDRQAKLAALEAALKPKEYEQAIYHSLEDEARCGTPGVYTEEQICLLYSIACENPADLEYPITHWTPSELRLEMIKRQIVPEISTSSIARFLKRR